jgi:hypothetical protein
MSESDGESEVYVLIDDDCVAGAMVAAAANPDERVLASLIVAGGDVAADQRYGWTACHEAAMNTNEKVLAMVIAAGADVNKVDFLGSLPCHSAASNRNEKVMGLLIAAGARVDEAACQIAVVEDNKRVLALLLLAAPEQAVSCMAFATSVGNYQCALMLAAVGVRCSNEDLQLLPRATRLKRWQGIADDGAGIRHARKGIQLVGFATIRERAAQICIALQPLRIPALQLCEIVTEACTPFAAQLDFHLLWNLVVAVKHFK